jgi:hypothetical protein
MACSDLMASHPRKCHCAWPAWQHGGFLVAERWWNHYACIQGTILYIVYNYHDSRAPSQEQSGILPRLVSCHGFLVGICSGLFGFGYGWSCWICWWERLDVCSPRSLEGCVTTLVGYQPLVVWLCANPRSYVPFNELILGWEIRLHSHSNLVANVKES